MGKPKVVIDDRFMSVTGAVTATSKLAKTEPAHVHAQFMSGKQVIEDEFTMKLMPDSEVGPTRWRYGTKYGWIPEN